MQQEVTKYRRIVKDDGTVTQKEIVLQCMSMNKDYKDAISADVPIDHSLVPRLVNARQFDVINFRRKVRFAIEKERIRCGRPADGSRTEKYKSYGKHVHALNRVREKGGSFVCTTNSVSSICDSLN